MMSDCEDCRSCYWLDPIANDLTRLEAPPGSYAVSASPSSTHQPPSALQPLHEVTGAREEFLGRQ
jgi:hypothetical protein